MMKTFYRLVLWFARVSLRLLFGLKGADDRNVPEKGPIIVAGNHQSYFDPPVLAVALRREMHFFAKKELFGIFGLGWLIRKLNSIPVRRGVYDPASLSRVAEALENGGGLIMFPEGTRGDGKTFLKPKPGIGLIAKRSRVKIVPAYISGTDKLSRAMVRRSRVHVIFGEPIEPDEIDRFADDKDGYRELAQTVMERIGDLKRQAAAD